MVLQRRLLKGKRVAKYKGKGLRSLPPNYQKAFKYSEFRRKKTMKKVFGGFVQNLRMALAAKRAAKVAAARANAAYKNKILAAKKNRTYYMYTKPRR